MSIRRFASTYKYALIIGTAGSFFLSAIMLRADPPSAEDPSPEQLLLRRPNTESEKVIADDAVVPLMRRKLDAAKEVLEGLALEDFAKIKKNARTLRLLSTEAGWKVIQTKEFMRQSADFRRACELIEKSANDKDASRAALSYVALTVRCVECHSYLRDNKITLTNSPAHLEIPEAKLCGGRSGGDPLVD